MNLSQLETVQLFSATYPDKLAKRPNLHYEGTSFGTVLTNVAVPSYEGVWKVTASVKRELLGEGRAAMTPDDVAGDEAVEMEEDEEPAEESAPGNMLVPVNCFEMPTCAIEEMMHRVGALAVIDLTSPQPIIIIIPKIKYIEEEEAKRLFKLTYCSLNSTQLTHSTSPDLGYARA